MGTKEKIAGDFCTSIELFTEKNSILVNVRVTVTCFQFFFQFYFKTNRQTAGSRTTNKNMYTGYADKSKQTI